MTEEVRTSRVVLVDAYMVVTGEITTGFHFYGPFKTRDKAGQWANENFKEGTFHRVHTLHHVKDGGFQCSSGQS